MMISTLCLCDDFDEDPSSLCIAQPLVPMWQFVNFADTCAYAGTISSHFITIAMFIQWNCVLCPDLLLLLAERRICAHHCIVSFMCVI